MFFGVPSLVRSTVMRAFECFPVKLKTPKSSAFESEKTPESKARKKFPGLKKIIKTGVRCVSFVFFSLAVRAFHAFFFFFENKISSYSFR